MKLYVVRHAIAFDQDPLRWPDDGERPLTRRGEKRFSKAAKGLRRVLGAPVEMVLSSPYVRAWDTAKLLHEHARWPEPLRCDALTGDRPPAQIIDEISQYAGVGSMGLVGHEPSLHELLSFLLAGDASTISVELRKGAVAFLEAPDGLHAGQARLHWLLPPRALRAFARS